MPVDREALRQAIEAEIQNDDGDHLVTSTDRVMAVLAPLLDVVEKAEACFEDDGGYVDWGADGDGGRHVDGRAAGCCYWALCSHGAVVSDELLDCADFAPHEPGFYPKECCESCHEDVAYGYELLGYDWGSVCCAISRVITNAGVDDDDEAAVRAFASRVAWETEQ